MRNSFHGHDDHEELEDHEEREVSADLRSCAEERPDDDD